jgi:hypothetical protein
MTTVLIIIRRSKTLVVAVCGLMAAVAAHAGPQLTFYITVPLDGPSNGHVLGLRVDHAASTPAIRNMNPSSPLNRRPWLDLQFGKDAALRLELDRRLTWDINRQQWHESSRPATFTLRVPTHERPARTETHAEQTPSLLASSRDQAMPPLLKSIAVEP